MASGILRPETNCAVQRAAADCNTEPQSSAIGSAQVLMAQTTRWSACAPVRLRIEIWTPGGVSRAARPAKPAPGCGIKSAATDFACGIEGPGPKARAEYASVEKCGLWHSLSTIQFDHRLYCNQSKPQYGYDYDAVQHRPSRRCRAQLGPSAERAEDRHDGC